MTPDVKEHSFFCWGAQDLILTVGCWSLLISMKYFPCVYFRFYFCFFNPTRIRAGSWPLYTPSPRQLVLDELQDGSRTLAHLGWLTSVCSSPCFQFRRYLFINMQMSRAPNICRTKFPFRFFLYILAFVEVFFFAFIITAFIFSAFFPFQALPFKCFSLLFRIEFLYHVSFCALPWPPNQTDVSIDFQQIKKLPTLCLPVFASDSGGLRATRLPAAL